MRIMTLVRPVPRQSIRAGGLGGLLLCLALVCACGAPRVTSGGAYSQIKPKEELAERELQEQPDNLVVRVFNVADARYSYKNYAVLFINDHEVEPPQGVDNFTSTYEYSMHLQEGVYDVRAEYHVEGGWRKRVVKIVPDEAVKILPNQRTTLEAYIKKDERGALAKPPARFALRYDEILPVAQTPK